MADDLRSMQTTYLHQIHPKLAQIDPANLIQSMQEMRYIQLVFWMKTVRPYFCCITRYWFRNIFSSICRVYNGGSQDELATLETCTLLDVFEQKFKSKENYRDVILYLFERYPALEEYVKCYYLPLPADWPGFYYPKKLITQGKEKRIATIIPEQGQFHVYLNAVKVCFDV